jgi:DNA polymerase III delta subunit
MNRQQDPGRQMQVYFIYGNQPLELKEMVSELTGGLLPKSDLQHAVFSFDVADFIAHEREKAKSQFQDFQNTCQTVSFFSAEIVVQLRNLQKIPTRKSPVDGIRNSLKEISLVKREIDGAEVWFDADSLVERTETRHHITGAQIVEEIVSCGGGVFFLGLESRWRERLVYRQTGKGSDAIELKLFLSDRIKEKLVFELPENVTPVQDAPVSGIVPVLKSYIEKPPSNVTLIFTADIRNTREINAEIYKALQKNAKELKGTVVQRAAKKQIKMDSESADLLIEISGTDFSALDKELDKLSLLFPPGTAVQPDSLMKSASHSKRFTIFRIGDFLVQKNLSKALESLEVILKDHPGESIAVFGLIASQFRRLLKISWLQEQGVAEKSIISQLKINPWVAKQAIKHTRRYSRLELENIVVHLAKTDLQIKFFAKDALTILENICFQICRGLFADKMYIERQWVP